HPAALRRRVSPRPRQSPPAPAQVERPEARARGHPAQRRGDPALVGGALARPEKKAEAEGWTLVWVDETGCYLLPPVVRASAPRGQTPILRIPWSREHLSVIGALTATGRFFCHVREASLRGPEVVRFLRHLLRHVPGKLLVIWDGATIHRNHTVQAFLAAG